MMDDWFRQKPPEKLRLPRHLKPKASKAALPAPTRGKPSPPTTTAPKRRTSAKDHDFQPADKYQRAASSSSEDLYSTGDSREPSPSSRSGYSSTRETDDDDRPESMDCDSTNTKGKPLIPRHLTFHQNLAGRPSNRICREKDAAHHESSANAAASAHHENSADAPAADHHESSADTPAEAHHESSADAPAADHHESFADTPATTHQESSGNSATTAHRESQIADAFTLVQSRRDRRRLNRQDPERPTRARIHPALRNPAPRPLNPGTSTVLLRPSGDTKTLHSLSLSAIFKELKPATVTAIRNIRNGGLAIDVPAGHDLTPLLNLQSLQGNALTATLPGTRHVSLGVVVSNARDADDLTELYKEHVNPPLATVRRLGSSNCYLLTFQGTTLPETVTILNSQVPVSPYYKSPVQCFNCQRFNHTAQDCRSRPACKHCGSTAHRHQDCTATTRCANCAGPHPANDRNCPHRIFELRVNKAQVKERVTRTEARQKLATSYADALRGRATSRANSSRRPGPSASRPPPSRATSKQGARGPSRRPRSPPPKEHSNSAPRHSSPPPKGEKRKPPRTSKKAPPPTPATDGPAAARRRARTGRAPPTSTTSTVGTSTEDLSNPQQEETPNTVPQRANQATNTEEPGNPTQPTFVYNDLAELVRQLTTALAPILSSSARQKVAATLDNFIAGRKGGSQKIQKK